MSAQPAFWRLDGSDSTLAASLDADLPRPLRCGARLGHEIDLAMLRTHDDTALAYAELDAVVPLTPFPEAAIGRTGSPALEGHRGGARFAHRFVTERVEREGDALAMRLVDEARERALCSVVATDNLRQTRPGHLPLAGLYPGRRYRLSLESIDVAELAPSTGLSRRGASGRRRRAGSCRCASGCPCRCCRRGRRS